MKKKLIYAVLFCLTLGLAPYVPHAHIWKQMKNIWLDRPMEGMDWFDLALHGAPWIYLIVLLVQLAAKAVMKKP